FLRAAATPGLSTLCLHDALPILSMAHALANVLAYALCPTPATIAAPTPCTAHPQALCTAHINCVALPILRYMGAAPSTHREFLRSEEHTSELQSRRELVCRLLRE